jgi:septal ring factor EnvC (AmiA/AmiB activator)
MRLHEEAWPSLASKQQAGAAVLLHVLADLQPPQRISTHFEDNQHHLPWPARGPVTAEFGDRVELTFGTVTTHNGIDIRAVAGSDVQAIADGMVVHADWVHGYGQVVIIDHGEHYHTVMAHLGTVLVQSGDRVARGQVIGTVGDSGSLRGTVLYLEIRRGAKALYPRQWLGR